MCVNASMQLKVLSTLAGAVGLQGLCLQPLECVTVIMKKIPSCYIVQLQYFLDISESRVGYDEGASDRVSDSQGRFSKHYSSSIFAYHPSVILRTLPRGLCYAVEASRRHRHHVGTSLFSFL